MSQDTNNPLTNLQHLPSAPVRRQRTPRIPKRPQPTYQQPVYKPTQGSLPTINQRTKLEPGNNEEFTVITRGIKPMAYFEDIMLPPTTPRPINQRNKLS